MTWKDELLSAARELSQKENLSLRSITFESLKRAQGLCSSTGDIKIKLHTNRLMELEVRKFHDVRTVSHELAHLKHFNHSEAFWEYQRELCKKLSSLLGMKVSGSYSIAGSYR